MNVIKNLKRCKNACETPNKQRIFFLNLVFNCWSYSLLPTQGLSVSSLLAHLKNWRFLAMVK